MRTKRQAALVALINEKTIRSQGEARQLLSNAGFKATQATISRDLEEIGAVRVHDVGGLKYSLPHAGSEHGASVQTAIKQFVVSARSAGNIVVVKTPPGHAAVVAAAIDRQTPTGVLGTVAGDDTLFICVESPKIGAGLVKILAE